jgi:hypothetical protein
MDIWHEFQNSPATWQTMKVRDIWHGAPYLTMALVSCPQGSACVPRGCFRILLPNMDTKFILFMVYLKTLPVSQIT